MLRQLLSGFLWLILGISVVRAQYSLGVRIGAGASSIYNNWKPYEGTLTNYLAPSATAGLFSRVDVGNHVFCELQAIVMQAEGRQKAYFPNSYYYQSGQKVFYSYSGDTRNHLTYLACPLYVGFKFKKLEILTGLQIARALRVATTGHYRTVVNDTVNDWKESNTYEVRHSGYRRTLGLCEGIYYQLGKHLKVGADYYFGVSDLPRYNWLLNWWQPWRIQQVTIGIKYTFAEKQ